MSVETFEILQEMASLTALSGRICEIQELNLKSFPYCFFEGVKKVEIDYDLSFKSDIIEDEINNKIVVNTPHKNLYVAYYLTLDEALNENLNVRFLELEKSVRFLFWKEVCLEVYFNNKIIYKSSKNG